MWRDVLEIVSREQTEDLPSADPSSWTGILGNHLKKAFRQSLREAIFACHQLRSLRARLVIADHCRVSGHHFRKACLKLIDCADRPLPLRKRYDPKQINLRSPYHRR